MKYDHDIILYFCGVHSSHVHKYLNLHKQFSERYKCLMLLSNSKWGTKQEVLNKYRCEMYNMENVHCLPDQDAINFLSKNKHRLGIFTSNYRKGHIGGNDIYASRSIGATTLQISEMPNDFYYFDSDYASLISKRLDRFSQISDNIKLFSNCFLWDVVDPGANLFLSRDDFYKKYELDDDKPFFVWTPSSIQCLHPRAQEIYDEVCKLPNVLVKLHPNEIRRHKAERVGFKWSYDLYSSVDVKLLDPLDTHYAFEYMDSLITYQSAIGFEAAFYKKPCTYLEINSKENLYTNDKSLVFDFVGKDCTKEDLREFILNRSYKADYDYEKFLKKYLANDKKTSCELLLEQVDIIL